MTTGPVDSTKHFLFASDFDQTLSFHDSGRVLADLLGVTRFDEKVAGLHLGVLGVSLTELSADQAAYLGVPVEGPYKADHYRY